MAKINKAAQAAMPQKLLLDLFEYNTEAGGLVNKTNRSSAARKGQPVGSLDKATGYIRVRINNHRYLVHRLVWTHVYGDYPNGEQPFIDHINGKRADNRIENLRVNSGGENQKNKQKSSKNTSGVTGVFRTSAWNGKRTKLNWYWRAFWYDENGKHRGKNFSIEKLGENEAKQAAIDYRAEQLRLLVNFGIKYSERHGT